MTEPVFVALGSNLGDRERYLSSAVEALDQLPGTTVESLSAIEETAAIGPGTQGPYLNRMVLVTTTLRPRGLLRAVQEIEDHHGRERGERWGPRTLDLDLVVFGDRQLGEPDLTIPHREVRHRPFWLRELAELFPRSWDARDKGFPAWARVSPDRRAHIDRVAGQVAAWAIARGVGSRERDRWVRAALLHDAARDFPEVEQGELAGVPWGNPALWHGPAAATLAARGGETDRGVLDAVRYHTVGYAGWDDVGRMLYLADYLEPGRPFARDVRARLAASVPNDPHGTLTAVARQRQIWLQDSGLDVPTETSEFWKHVGVPA